VKLFSLSKNREEQPADTVDGFFILTRKPSSFIIRSILLSMPVNFEDAKFVGDSPLPLKTRPPAEGEGGPVTGEIMES
jgi:hypothetical protein